MSNSKCLPKDKWKIALAEEQNCGKTRDAALKLYNEWGNEFDVTMREWGTNIYAETCSILMECIVWEQITGSHMRVLDLGCGSGLLAESIRKEEMSRIFCCVPSINIIGVDISTEMLKVAVQKSVYDECILNDIQSSLTAFADASFDVICAIMVLGYVDFHKFYEESRRVTKDSGFIIFTCYENSPNLDFIAEEHELGNIRLIKVTEPASVYPNNPEYVKKLSCICAAQICKSSR